MPSALANRFTHIDFEVDVDQWADWARDTGIAPEVISFIRFRPGLLHDFDPERDARAFPSPRSWEFVSRLIPSAPESGVFSDLVAGTVGAGAGAEFCGFLSLWEQLPSAGDVLADPAGIAIPEDPAVLFALCEMMGAVLDGENADDVLTWALRLPAEFSVLVIREAVRHNPDVVHTRAFGQWAETHAEVLV